MPRATAMSIVEALAVAAMLAVGAVLVLPVLGGLRLRIDQGSCRRQLQLASAALRQYASANAGAFPTCGYGPGTVDFSVIGWNVDQQARQANSNSRNLFLAVRLKYVQPRMLVCPATDDEPAPLRGAGSTYHDFAVGSGQGYRNRLSYSYHLQFAGRKGQPGCPIRADSPPGMALLADRSPMLVYPGGPVGGGTVAQYVGLPAATPAEWANSFNHNCAGQNVAFVDGRVLWFDRPTAGVDDDNIYTVWLGPDRQGGDVDRASMPQGPTDSFLVP